MAEDASMRWPTPWIRAAMGTAVLAVLEDTPRHGYAIAVALEEAGFGRPRGGSLYPLLSGLEHDGAVVAVWEQRASGPGRRTYEITARGRERLANERSDWQSLVAALSEKQTSA